MKLRKMSYYICTIKSHFKNDKIMSYDIYGENLRNGHCEVHPHVHEPYPCSVCLSENDNRPNFKAQQRYYDNAEREYYEAMEREHYEEMAREDSFYFRFLTNVVNILSTITKYAESIKLKQYNRVCYNLYQKR